MSDGLGKIILEGETVGKKELGEKDREGNGKGTYGDVFNMSLIEVGRLAIDRNRFRSVVKDATPYGDNLQLE